jgi:hypothetical protein
MNRCALILGLVFTLCLAGCASLSIDPRVVGTYSAENSETLIFMPDGRVFHTELVSGNQKRVFLGYYASGRRSPHSLGFVAPDTSPFLGTSFEVNEVFSTVTVKWDSGFRPEPSWQISYRKDN